MESKENPEPTTFNIKDMTNLLIDKTTIGTPITASIDKFTFNKYNLVNPPPKSKRILNSNTVRYFCQGYFFDEKNQRFEIFDKNYKNIKKDKISNMKQDKRWIRYCLLLMSEGEQTLFEINKDILEDFYNPLVKEFFERRKKDKIKELKQIEREKRKEKYLKEKEELEKKGELKKEEEKNADEEKQPKQKQEIKIDMNIVNDVPNQYKLEEKVYFRIYTEDVYIEKPPFPNKIKDLEAYVKNYNSEIKRLLLKEEKKEKDKREYTLPENWCKDLITKILSMTKGDLRDEYESESYKLKRKKIEEELKKPIINLMFIYANKTVENREELIQSAINLVEKTYYKKYKEQYDESFLKITSGYINFLIEKGDFSKAKKAIGIIKEKCSTLKDSETIIKELETQLEETKKKKNDANIIASKGKIKAGLDDSKPDYDWQQGQNEEELNDSLNKDVKQVQNNIALISNQ